MYPQNRNQIAYLFNEWVFGRICNPPELNWGFAIPKKNINYLNNIALGMAPASNELSRTPSLE